MANSWMTVINGVTMNDRSQDSNTSTTRWLLDNIDGWDGAKYRQNVVTPDTRHGKVMASAYYDARTITINGLCVSPNENQFWADYDGIQTLFNNLTEERIMTVHQTLGMSKFVRYVSAGPAQIKQGRFALAYEWQATLLCPDHRKYDSVQQSVTIAAGATGTITNNGTLSTPIVVNSAGAGTLQLKFNGGANGTFTANPTGNMTTDFRTQTATIGSADRLELVTSNSVWYDPQPGTTTVQNTGTIPVTITYYHAYL